MTSSVQFVNLHALISITPGSAEQGSIYLRVNSTTDYLISSTMQWNATFNYAYNIPPLMTDEITPFDYIEIKIVTPAWLTPPTGVLYWGSIAFASGV